MTKVVSLEVKFILCINFHWLKSKIKSEEMIKITVTNLVYLVIYINFSLDLSAQRVYPLDPSVFVDSIYKVKAGATKLAMDPISGRFFYSTVGGEIYEIYYNPVSGNATDTLRYTAINHGITFLQGLCFHDSAMYVCGNIWPSTNSIGKIVKGTLQSNGTRIWVDVVVTEPYPSSSSTGDHGFSAINIDPTGTNIFISSGARTSFGEIRSNGGVWPGKREVPLSSRIFKFPINTIGLTLPNDSTLLDNSGFVFAWGTRNAYDMAWDGNNNLFAIDNSGERDDPEELNWLRQGKHYGFPWRMGGNDNPLRTSPYDVKKDLLVNPLSGGYLAGWFADDPTFPNVPVGITFMDPVRNFGKDADYYRDPFTGKVKKASAENTFISSFTAHRSPLGLAFDRDSTLAYPFRGSGFVLSFMPGGDSTGYTPLSPWGSPCPFVDPSRELMQLKLSYDSSIDNYTMTCTNIVEGFYLPVDAELINNELYVIENGGSLWKIKFPSYVGINEEKNKSKLSSYPNPFQNSTIVKFYNPNSIKYTLNIYNIFGQIVRSFNNVVTDEIVFERVNLTNGIYFMRLESENKTVITGKLIIE